MAEGKHQPTAIIAAECVGFSRLVGIDVEATPAARRETGVENIARPVLILAVTLEEVAPVRASKMRDLKFDRLLATTVPPPARIGRVDDS